MMDERLLTMLLMGGVKDADKINNELLKSEELRMLTDKQVAVAAICYGAAMSKLTSLSLEDYISMAAYAYDQIISKAKDESNGQPSTELPAEQ